MNTSKLNTANSTQPAAPLIDITRLDQVMQANTRAWTTVRMLADDEMAIVDRCKYEAGLALSLAAEDITAAGDFLTDLADHVGKSVNESSPVDDSVSSIKSAPDMGWLPDYFTVPEHYAEFPTDSVMNIAAQAAAAASSNDPGKHGISLAGHLSNLAASICDAAGAVPLAELLRKASDIASDLICSEAATEPVSDATTAAMNQALIQLLKRVESEAHEYPNTQGHADA